MAAIIRTVMPSFGAVGPGFAINDPEVDHMSRAYGREGALFFVVEHHAPGEAARVVGGGGIAPLDGNETGERICELRKMYFLPEARGHGVGSALLQRCLWAARGLGYSTCYLETLASMTQAVRLYEQAGFRQLDAALGHTGHHGCDRHYARALVDLSDLPDLTEHCPLPTLADVQAAARRIAGTVRRTPTLDLTLTKNPPAKLGGLFCKLELLQVTGSFKARGVMNKLRSLPTEALAGGIVTASSGNHGLAVAYAGSLCGVPTTIFLPTTVPQAKLEKLRQYGARIEQIGQVFDESNEAALGFAARHHQLVVHPFADPLVIAGQGTLLPELLEDVPHLDTLLVAIGGGGLIGGVAVAAKALRPSIRIIGVEPAGAPTLQQSVQAGRLVRLAEINTLAGTLAPKRSAAVNLALVSRLVDDIVLVSDEQMRAAARFLWFEASIAAELSGAAAMAALHSGCYRPHADERVGVIVCGAGTDGMPA